MTAIFTTGRRCLSLWFPRLSPDRILRLRHGRFWRSAALHDGPPLALWRSEKGADRLCALDERAAALGLRPGMGLADARAMHPGTEFTPADAAADAQLLSGLADWCDRYTPLAALDGVDGIFLDITGCAHLFGGEKALLDDLLARLFHQGFAVSAAIASTPGAAWAQARYSGGGLIAPGNEAAALSPLPLAALRIEAPARSGLESVGLKTAAALIGAPRAPIARRFGVAVLERLDQALGCLDEPLSPRLPLPLVSAERRLAEPAELPGEIEHLAFMLASSLKDELERRGEGARRLELVLFRVDGAVSRMTLGLSQPLRDPLRIRRLFRERLAAEPPDAGFGFDLVRLSVLAAAPFASLQGDLSGADAAGAAESLAAFADRVQARLGEGALLRPAAADSHVPERAAGFVAFAAPAAIVDEAHAPDAARPIRIFGPPEPVDAMAGVPDGPPVSFRWRRALHRVVRAEGPERIAPEWWRGDSPARDYFRVEDEVGRRYWLMRQGLYGAGPAPRWFMHGACA